MHTVESATHVVAPADADVVDNGTIVSCSCHGSRFDKNGNALNGPADQPLPRLSTVYDLQTDELTIG